MTCIAGLVYEGKVYIGGDSAGVRGPFHIEVLETTSKVGTETC